MSTAEGLGAGVLSAGYRITEKTRGTSSLRARPHDAQEFEARPASSTHSTGDHRSWPRTRLSRPNAVRFRRTFIGQGCERASKAVGDRKDPLLLAELIGGLEHLSHEGLVRLAVSVAGLVRPPVPEMAAPQLPEVSVDEQRAERGEFHVPESPEVRSVEATGGSGAARREVDPVTSGHEDFSLDTHGLRLSLALSTGALSECATPNSQHEPRITDVQSPTISFSGRLRRPRDPSRAPRLPGIRSTAPTQTAQPALAHSALQPSRV